MNVVPLPGPGLPWQPSPLRPILRACRLTIGTIVLGVVPICFATMLGALNQHAAGLISSAFLICFLIVRSLPRRKYTVLRWCVALVLVAPWALGSAALFVSLFPFRRVGHFAVHLAWATVLGAAAVYGFRIVAFPSVTPVINPWPPGPENPPMGGAPVPAPLKPPPPLLQAADAKPLPHAARERFPDMGAAVPEEPLSPTFSYSPGESENRPMS